ncbi:MAG: hypothetical protein LAO20_21915 [Acidobacteriia bacterium]|nr:hypothetical protein [Terriglobia bacterium]
MAEQEKAEYEYQADQEAQAVAEPRVSFLELAIKLADWKRFIFYFVGIATVLAIVVSLLWPKSYTANAKIMPPQQGQSAVSMLGQLTPLAAIAGRDLGLRNPGDVYIYILKSRTVADAIVDRFSLLSVYNSKMRVNARKKLAANSQITSGREGGITISVTDHDPRRAASLANGYVEELEKLTRTLAVTDAAKRRLFFEREVQKAADELSQAELAMKQTQEKTGILQVDSQSRVVIELLAGLHARAAAQEAQVEAMRSYATPGNPDFIRAQTELAALRTELARVEAGQNGKSVVDVAVKKVPEAALEYLRSLREVKYREALYELLSRQYETARLEEARDSAIVQILDKAEPPELKSAPQRAIIVLTTAFVAFLLAIAFAFFSERIKADPATMASLQLLRSRLTWRSQARES